jgi:hypothetical protein
MKADSLSKNIRPFADENFGVTQADANREKANFGYTLANVSPC